MGRKSVALSILLPNPASNLACLQHEPAFLYISQAAKLDDKQRQQVEQIRAAHDDLESAYALTQEFVSMLAKHRDMDLDGWLARAKHSGIKELKSFAHGIQRDDAAVRATFTRPLE